MGSNVADCLASYRNNLSQENVWGYVACCPIIIPYVIVISGMIGVF